MELGVIEHFDNPSDISDLPEKSENSRLSNDGGRFVPISDTTLQTLLILGIACILVCILCALVVFIQYNTKKNQKQICKTVGGNKICENNPHYNELDAANQAKSLTFVSIGFGATGIIILGAAWIAAGFKYARL